MIVAMRSRRTSFVVAVCSASCAVAETEAIPPADLEPGTSSSTSSGTSGESGAESAATDTGSPDSTAGCECGEPPGDCWQGECEAGDCTWQPRLAGDPCTDDCAAGGFCDAGGTCICTEVQPDCEATCIAGANQTATCDDAGACTIACVAPWQDCDGDTSNGCEVPVGVAHTCSASGLVQSGGCWTAYCGNSASPEATNFGAYHCIDCVTCEEPGGGQCHWCNHGTGTWYDLEACACGAEYLGAVCAG
jgi:hypothetical protein